MTWRLVVGAVLAFAPVAVTPARPPGPHRPYRISAAGTYATTEICGRDGYETGTIPSGAS